MTSMSSENVLKDVAALLIGLLLLGAHPFIESLHELHAIELVRLHGTPNSANVISLWI